MAQMVLSKKQHQIRDIENRLVVAKGKSGGSWTDREFGVSRCKLLHFEWINNKVLIYNTRLYPIS